MRTRTRPDSPVDALEVAVLAHPVLVRAGTVIASQLAARWPGSVRVTVTMRPRAVVGPAVVVVPENHRGPVPPARGRVGLVVYGARRPGPDVVATWREEIRAAGGTPGPFSGAVATGLQRHRGFDAFDLLTLDAVLDELRP